MIYRFREYCFLLVGLSCFMPTTSKYIVHFVLVIQDLRKFLTQVSIYTQVYLFICQNENLTFNLIKFLQEKYQSSTLKLRKQVSGTMLIGKCFPAQNLLLK